MGAFEDALAIRSILHETDPHHLLDRNNYAWNLVHPDWDPARWDPELAVQVARPAAMSAATCATWVDTYAWALHCNGQHKEAIKQGQRALRLQKAEGGNPQQRAELDDRLAKYRAAASGQKE